MAKTPNEMISETHDMVIEIKTALFGMPGSKDEGICGKVNDVKNKTSELDTRLTVVETKCKNTPHNQPAEDDSSILPSNKKGKVAVGVGAGAGGLALLMYVIELVKQLIQG